MSFDYSFYENSPDNLIREPQIFDDLKRDTQFVSYLSRKIEPNVSLKGNEWEIADKILKLAQHDTEFGVEILHEFKIITNYDDSSINKIHSLLTSSALFKPSKFYSSSASPLGSHSPVPSFNDANASPSINRRSSPLNNQTSPPPIMPADLNESYAPVLDQMLKYIHGDLSINFEGPIAETLNFLNGKAGIDEMVINSRNSSEYLIAVKLWDHALATANFETNNQMSFDISSYSLRTCIAEKGRLPSHQVYTKTLDPQEYENWDYLDNQSNWIPERVRVHTKIIEINIIKAFALSRRLNTEKPSFWGVRGNTGAGKTYCISNDPKFAKALDENGNATGAINPDSFKKDLRADTPKFSHEQVHKEGSALSYQFAQSINKEVNATMIIDMRLAMHTQIEKDLINAANAKSGNVLLVDIETPLITSINRVLTRSPEGGDPIVPLQVIIQGYEDVHAERAKVLQEVKTNDTVNYFKFYVTDANGEQQLVAKKENGLFEVISGMEDALARACEKPSLEELNESLNQRIDDNYIEQAQVRDRISPSKIGMIEKWRGYTVRDALNNLISAREV